MSKWDDAAAWAGDGLRREVFYFGPDEARLYGSLYSAESPSRSDGVLICASWGYEADRTERLAHRIALTAARLGGAGMIFHYPGYGDSHGEALAEATLDSLAQAAALALTEASQRRPQLAWFPAGLMVGSAIACLAQRLAPAVGRLLLVQPSLSPSAYFATLAKSAQRVSLGPGRIAEMSFAYPLPRAILAAGPGADLPVREALSEFAGDGTVIRCAKPGIDPPAPERFDELTVEGSWRFGMQAEWLAA
jgi:alpha-beta hydrolase superfamily lysophospholipase